MAGADPVVARRRRIARAAQAGRRLGFACDLLAIAVVIAAAARDSISAPVAGAAFALLVAGSLVLLPSIVAGYGVRAAERDERAQQD